MKVKLLKIMVGLSLTLIILTLIIFTLKVVVENNPPAAEAQAVPDVPNHNVGSISYPRPANPERPISPYLDQSANVLGHI